MRNAPNSPRTIRADAANPNTGFGCWRGGRVAGAPGGRRHRARSHGGFTIVELLVVVAVVSLLLAVALPALSRSRQRAREGTCLSVLHTLGKAAHDRDGPSAGTWPTLFERGQTLANYSSDTTTVGLDPVGQSLSWAGAILNEEAFTAPPDAWSCPGDIHPRGTTTGPGASGGGYWYSSACFTDPRLWEPTAGERRLQPNQWAAPVLRSDTKHPSHKAVFIETASRHGNGEAIWSRSVGVANAVFADGHAERVEPLGFQAALPLRMNLELYGVGPLNGVSIPTSSPAWGIRGRDR